MRRFLIFTVLYPLLALAIFTAPDAFKNFIDWIGYAYPAAIFPAWLTAAIDGKLSVNPAYVRIGGAAIAGALTTAVVGRLLSGGFTELFPSLMILLVGGIPAAVCSWLSGKSVKAANA